MPRFVRDVTVSTQIPTASMADIAFLLLIFFLATAVVHAQRAIDVRLPLATRGIELPEEHLLRLWIGRDGELALEERAIDRGAIEAALDAARAADPDLVVAIHADLDTPNEVVLRALDLIEAAGVSNVLFAHETRAAGAERAPRPGN